MGNQESSYDSGEALSATEFVYKVREACKKDKLDEYESLWRSAEAQRKTDSQYDADLLDNKILDLVSHAFRSQKMDWRKAGIISARTLLHLQKARKKLVTYAFIESVLLITLPDEVLEEDEQAMTTADHAKKEAEQDELQLLAADTLREMAGYQDFHPSLCTTSVLNFLCIVLNQVPRSVELVTDTFVKLSSDQHNLVILMEGAMGDILETFFKQVKFKKPAVDEDAPEMKQWYKDTPALSHTAHTLGTLIKYNHQPQVDFPQIIKVFAYTLGMDGPECEPVVDPTIENIGPHVPDNVLLLAELSRLFYWICRRERDLQKLLYATSPLGPNDMGLDYVLKIFTAMWKRCIHTQDVLKQQKILPGSSKEFLTFCAHDLDRTKVLDASSPEVKLKMEHAQMRLCYLNCTLWLLIGVQRLRWKLKDCGLTDLHLCFELENEAHLQVILGTVRYIVDLPEAQETNDFIKFFGQQLILLVDKVIDPSNDDQKRRNEKGLTQDVIRLLVDAISILAMQREMQTMLADYNIYDKLTRLKGIKFTNAEEKSNKAQEAIALCVLRIFAEVAMHPSHRLAWCSKTKILGDSKNFGQHPPRKKFEDSLKTEMSCPDDNTKTIASLLLTIFQEDKFKKSAEDIDSVFRSVLDWWQSNTTARFEEEKEADTGETAGVTAARQAIDVKKPKNLSMLLARAIDRAAQKSTLTSMDTMKYCAPHECVLALSLFSRLALEPRFKALYVKHDALDALLGCVCVGIWAEAREAAACIANLMWLPDLNEEGLVCWLKLDGPRCITVDASNILMPVRTGTPKPVDIGKGMYKSSWGIEFVDGSYVTLHPEGLKTNEIPGLLTSASPADTFENTSKSPYEWLGRKPHQRCFTITCWFYWPDDQASDENGKREEKRWNKVLIQSRARVPSEPSEALQKPDDAKKTFETDMTHSYVLYIDYESDKNNPEGKWTIIEEKGGKKHQRPLMTPKLKQGWHMLALVSSTNEEKRTAADGKSYTKEEFQEKFGPLEERWEAAPVVKENKEFEGTKFFLDEWSTKLENVWVANDFYRVGNAASNIAAEDKPSPTDAKRPFGLITDFRIYARVLRDDQIKTMVKSRDVEQHPDKLARMLAEKNAAKILAQRLDVPDSAAECLRALGSLATLAPQRAKIFSECGRQVLRMLESPQPMIQRQAARLVNNIF